MKTLVYIFNWFYLFSLSLWVGGMFLIGFLVEFQVRNGIEDPILRSNVMGGIMDIFIVHIIYTCIVLMVLAEVVKFLVSKYAKVGYVTQKATWSLFSKEALLPIMIVLAIYMGSIFRPQMHENDRLKRENPENAQLIQQSKANHSRFVWIFTVNMILGLRLFYIHGKEMTRFKGDSTG